MMQKYIFREYKENFPKLFRKEKKKLMKLLIKDIDIEHVGSTSVPGLGGKGIIDVIIAVSKKDIKKIKDRLQEKGYKFKPKAGDKDRLFFEKDYKNKKEIRRVHIHLTSKNSIVWKKSIAVRDYLRKNRQASVEYAKIKKRAVKFARGEGKKYREYKDKFLKELTK